MDQLVPVEVSRSLISHLLAEPKVASREAPLGALEDCLDIPALSISQENAAVSYPPSTHGEIDGAECLRGGPAQEGRRARRQELLRGEAAGDRLGREGAQQLVDALLLTRWVENNEEIAGALDRAEPHGAPGVDAGTSEPWGLLLTDQFQRVGDSWMVRGEVRGAPVGLLQLVSNGDEVLLLALILHREASNVVQLRHQEVEVGVSEPEGLRCAQGEEFIPRLQQEERALRGPRRR